MAKTFHFLSAPDEDDVLDWFRSQSEVAEEHPNSERMLLFYRQFGPLTQKADGSGADPANSPLVSIYKAKVRRSVLWTVGEVHFLYKGASRFPTLERLRKRFQTWLCDKPIAWERKGDGLEGYGYYLEGSVKNIADTVYALPRGLAAFEAGQYFVAEHDNDAVLDRLCRSLRLRGVDCV
jgi:hypothetical protein